MWAAPSHGLGSQDEEKEESEVRVKHQSPLLCSPTVAARGTSCFTVQPPRRELHPQTVSQLKPSLLTSPP